MLVIASDFARPAFSDAEVFSGLKEIAWRKDLQVDCFLGPADAQVGIEKSADGNGASGGEWRQFAGDAPNDVGVASFALAEGSVRPVVGAEMTFEARIINNGDEAVVRDLPSDNRWQSCPQALRRSRPLTAAVAGSSGWVRYVRNAALQRVQLGPA